MPVVPDLHDVRISQAVNRASDLSDELQRTVAELRVLLVGSTERKEEHERNEQ